MIKRMMGGYPSLSVHDPKVYVAELVALLVGYPTTVGERALAQACRDSPNFIPTVPQVEKAITDDPFLAPRPALTWADEWDARAQAQLDERERFEREGPSPEEKARVTQKFKDLLTYLRRDKTGEDKQYTPAAVMKKYNLTLEQWNALPDQPEDADCWRRLGNVKPGFGEL